MYNLLILFLIIIIIIIYFYFRVVLDTRQHLFFCTKLFIFAQQLLYAKCRTDLLLLILHWKFDCDLYLFYSTS